MGEVFRDRAQPGILGSNNGLLAHIEDRLHAAAMGQWKTPVLYLLGEKGPARFGEIQRLVIGISPKVLTQRLHELEADGLVWRAHEPTIPPKVTSG